MFMVVGFFTREPTVCFVARVHVGFFPVSEVPLSRRGFFWLLLFLLGGVFFGHSTIGNIA